ncbi:MAG: FeoB small GTPase domain-containing protein [Halarcobacter ebronensis]
MNNIKVALAGQPNCGKSTIFNLVSGIEQHIANYPGVTVDKKVGYFKYDNHKIEMVDLPGTYSFSSYSLEERVAKDFILDESPDVIVNVIDASNIKRNLYLTFQLLEIGIPVVVVLNMMDVAKRRDIEIDSKKISQMLNCPVVEASGAKGLGGKDIMKNIVATANNKNSYQDFKINYDELELHINNLEERISKIALIQNKRWLAIKLLENDSTIIERVKKYEPSIEEFAKKKKILSMKDMIKMQSLF